MKKYFNEFIVGSMFGLLPIVGFGMLHIQFFSFDVLFMLGCLLIVVMIIYVGRKRFPRSIKGFMISLLSLLVVYFLTIKFIFMISDIEPMGLGIIGIIMNMYVLPIIVIGLIVGSVLTNKFLKPKSLV